MIFDKEEFCKLVGLTSTKKVEKNGYGPFEQSNSSGSQEGINCTKTKELTVLVYILWQEASKIVV